MKKKSFFYILSAAFFAAFLFLLILLLTVDRAEIGADGEMIGLSHLNGAFRDAIGYHPFFRGVTDASGVLLIAGGLFFAFMGFRSLCRNRKFALVEREYYVLAALYIAMAIIYFACRKLSVNCRPLILPGEGAEASFPSSHVLLAVCVGASAIPMLRMIFCDKPKCRIIGETAAWTLLLVTVLGRTVAGVHWLTDIFGGLLLGFALVMLFFALIAKESRI